MGLGELYHPSGLALEHAEAVLEVRNPWACNVALGCECACKYCYLKRYDLPSEMRLPKNMIALVKQQLSNGIEPEGVFLSFLCDCFHWKVAEATESLINLLHDIDGCRVATLSKLGMMTVTDKSNGDFNLRPGMTIVSVDDKFRRTYEPNTCPVSTRLEALRMASGLGDYTWISVEPYPPPTMWPQDPIQFLDKIVSTEPNLIVLGKLNYDKRGNDRTFYRWIVQTFQEYCHSQNIRLWIKSDTLEFVARKEVIVA